MADYSDLIQQLDTKLNEFNYIRDNEIAIPNILYVTYVRSSGILRAKNLCAVIDMPDNIVDISTGSRFFKFVKESLLEKYGDAILWKELEMCLIVLCEEKLYDIFEADEGKVTNQASFSLNALLGTAFINKKTLKSFGVSTWGIYFSGDHFKSINAIVEKWCEDQGAGLADESAPAE